MSAGPTRFVVIGDATLDVTVRARMAPEAGRDHPAHITTGPGGQGGNVAVRLARMGTQVRVVTALGDDDAGRLIEGALASEGVEVAPMAATRTGIVVALVGPDGERSMLSDRVSFAVPVLSALPPAFLADADWIHVSGYVLADPESGQALAEFVAARTAGVRCSVGGGSFADRADIRAALTAVRPDLVLFDRGEGMVALADARGETTPGTMADLARALSAAYRTVAVVTDGPNPIFASRPDGSVGFVSSSWPRVALDTTGAGDAVAAAVIGILARGHWPPSMRNLGRALERGSRLGGEVAGVVGAQARVPSER